MHRLHLLYYIQHLEKLSVRNILAFIILYYIKLLLIYFNTCNSLNIGTSISEGSFCDCSSYV